jgi:hypothetical protein
MNNAQHWCFRMPWYTTKHGRVEQLRKFSYWHYGQEQG